MARHATVCEVKHIFSTRILFFSTSRAIIKYEYRDIWLTFSTLLQNASSVTQVLEALHHVLVNTLYTEEIWVWMGNEANGLELIRPTTITDKEPCRIIGSDPIISYLRQHPYLDLTCQKDFDSKSWCATSLAALPPPLPILFTPLIAANQLVGCIGLGQQYTGGRYSQEDFDLLTALGCQAASALLTAQLTKKNVHRRERRTLQNMSTFLLHNIKNAASILSLIHTNAATHMDNPEFRKDMITAIGDALHRMEKAQTSLDILRDRVESVWQAVILYDFLDELQIRFSRRLPGLKIVLDCHQKIYLRTDPHLLETVFENLLLNAYEAGNGSCQVVITATSANGSLTIGVCNNGPAIPDHLLPDQLFHRFVSNKPDGSGIGLWQASLVLQRLGATITADNPAEGGARFIIQLPMAKISNESSVPVA